MIKCAACDTIKCAACDRSNALPSVAGVPDAGSALVVHVLGLGPLLPVLLESFLVLLELALLGDEGVQHRQSLLLLQLLVVVLVLRLEGVRGRHLLEVQPVRRRVLEVLLSYAVLTWVIVGFRLSYVTFLYW